MIFLLIFKKKKSNKLRSKAPKSKSDAFTPGALPGEQFRIAADLWTGKLEKNWKTFRPLKFNGSTFWIKSFDLNRSESKGWVKRFKELDSKI